MGNILTKKQHDFKNRKGLAPVPVQAPLVLFVLSLIIL